MQNFLNWLEGSNIHVGEIWIDDNTGDLFKVLDVSYSFEDEENMVTLQEVNKPFKVREFFKI